MTLQVLADMRERLAELGPTELRLIETSASVLILLALRGLVLSLVRRNVEDMRALYAWRKSVTYATMFLGVLLVGRIWLQAFGSIATFLGLIGAGVAVALKDPLANLAGWIFIVWRRPFRVGDRVQLAEQAGDVVDIRLFQFILLEIGNWVNADQSTGRLLHVPNGKVFTSPIANYTEGFPFIWDEIPVLLTFESNWRDGKEILLEVARRHVGEFAARAEREILAATRRYMIFYTTLQPAVYTSVRANSVVLTIRYVCDARQRRSIAAAIWEDILNAFEGRPDMEFAYPTARFFESARDVRPELVAEPRTRTARITAEPGA